MYINTNTMEYPVSQHQIRMAHPTTTFPKPFTPPEEYAYVHTTPAPEYDRILQFVVEAAPELTELGHYEQRWEIRERYATQQERDDAMLVVNAAVQEQRRIALNQERDRRIASGAGIPVTGYGSIPLTGTERDQTLITGLLLKAQGYKAAEVTDPIMVIRDRDNVNHYLTPDQMIELTVNGMRWVEEIMKISWNMKDGVIPFEDGIPADFASNDTYWEVEL